MFFSPITTKNGPKLGCQITAESEFQGAQIFLVNHGSAQRVMPMQSARDLDLSGFPDLKKNPLSLAMSLSPGIWKNAVCF